MPNVTGQRQGSVITALLPCVKTATNHSNYVFLVWRNMKINKDNYEVVRFADKTTNSTTRKIGYRVGEFLVVGYADSRRENWRIYRLQDGLKCIQTTFATSDDAIQCAEWIDKTYRNEHGESYFFIWSEYPHAELFRWTSLTIEDGEKYWKHLDVIAKQKNVKWEDVCSNFN